MTKGQVVKVHLFGGDTGLRRVVSVKAKVIVICCEAEYQQALIEQREPEGLGFPHADVEDNPRYEYGDF